MPKKEWVGKLRIYLFQRNACRPFCWMSMDKDGSLFFGFSSKTRKLTEYGSSVVRSGRFTNHSQILTRGNIDIKNTNKPHISFHPPRITQKTGIAHMVDAKGTVDEWDLDWFPVRKPQAILFAYTGDISTLEQITQPKGNHQIAKVPDNIHCLLMELVLYPIPKTIQMIGSSDTLTNIIGFCPNYIVCCGFYPVNSVDQAVYIATDKYSKRLGSA